MSDRPVGHTLTPPDGSPDTGSGPVSGQDLADKRVGLLGTGSVEQKNSCSSCTYHICFLMPLEMEMKSIYIQISNCLMQHTVSKKILFHTPTQTQTKLKTIENLVVQIN